MNKFQSYDYMCLLRTLVLAIMMSIIYSSVSAIGKLYVVFLIVVFVISNYLLWKGYVETRTQKRIFFWTETTSILLLVVFSPHTTFVGLVSLQIVTVCILFRDNWERNIYASVLAATGIAYSLTNNWQFYKTNMINSLILLELLPYLFFYFVGSAISKLEQQKEELQDLNETLETYANKVKELAVAEERNRLARDIHDTVAHRATGLIMQLQAAKGILSKKPEKVEALIDNCLDVSKQMLDEMRKSVRALAPSVTQNLFSDEILHELVDSFAEQTGLRTKIDIFGERRELSSGQQIAIYRAIQEALTNAKRHGHASEVVVLIKYLPYVLKVTIRDNGHGCDNVENGFGLSGMEQRISNLGGTLAIESSSEGFQLNLSLPYYAKEMNS